MMVKHVFAAIAALAVTLAGCGGGGGDSGAASGSTSNSTASTGASTTYDIDTAKYLPAAKGMRWMYRVTDPDGPITDQPRQVVAAAEVSVNGSTWSPRNASMTIKSGGEGAEFVRFTSEGVVALAETDISAASLTSDDLDSSYLLVPKKVSLNIKQVVSEESVEDYFDDDSVLDTLTLTRYVVARRVADLVTQVGTMQDVIYLEHSYDVKVKLSLTDEVKEASFQHQKIWLAPHVGIVKRIYELGFFLWDKPKPVTEEIIGFKLGDSVAGFVPVDSASWAQPVTSAFEPMYAVTKVVNNSQAWTLVTGYAKRKGDSSHLGTHVGLLVDDQGVPRWMDAIDTGFAGAYYPADIQVIADGEDFVLSANRFSLNGTRDYLGRGSSEYFLARLSTGATPTLSAYQSVLNVPLSLQSTPYQLLKHEGLLTIAHFVDARRVYSETGIGYVDYPAELMLFGLNAQGATVKTGSFQYGAPPVLADGWLDTTQRRYLWGVEVVDGQLYAAVIYNSGTQRKFGLLSFDRDLKHVANVADVGIAFEDSDVYNANDVTKFYWDGTHLVIRANMWAYSKFQRITRAGVSVDSSAWTLPVASVGGASAVTNDGRILFWNINRLESYSLSGDRFDYGLLTTSEALSKTANRETIPTKSVFLNTWRVCDSHSDPLTTFTAGVNVNDLLKTQLVLVWYNGKNFIAVANNTSCKSTNQARTVIAFAMGA